ncbi:MAG: hypothetical protein H6813_04515 [Phycisphaeraceae bacterium]|nr:hypothetical protein [Phycisphaeraceae bacterium]MCB9847212.1 hypothetical protein [Phycisphaeraceae bacterium]
MPKLPRCRYSPYALRAALRTGRPPGGERVVGWGAAAREHDAGRQAANIAFGLLPIIGDLAWLFTDNKRWLQLVLTDRRLLILSTLSPVVGHEPEHGPTCIDIELLDIAHLDEPGAFRIAGLHPETGMPRLTLSLKIELGSEQHTPQANLDRGLRLLAGGADSEPDFHGSPHNPGAESWEPRPSRWT